jgi:hypothetical protein
MDNKLLSEFITKFSTDQKFQLTEDTSLLSEERYPLELSPLFESLTKPTSLQDAMNLLQWDRTKAGGYLDKSAYEHVKVQQNSLRRALQLTLDTDSPWEKVQYQDWKDKITVIVLSAVQKVAIAGVKSDKPLHWIYSPKLVDPTKTVRKQDDNIEGLQYLHPLLLDPPWEEPAKLDSLLLRLCSERDPVTYGQASSKSTPDRIKAKVRIRAHVSSMAEASPSQDIQVEQRHVSHLLSTRKQISPVHQSEGGTRTTPCSSACIQSTTKHSSCTPSETSSSAFCTSYA